MRGEGETAVVMARGFGPFGGFGWCSGFVGNLAFKKNVS
ncbi:hypothetical protein RR42_s3269 [Cupriavidus basilensis]|uniref:Uncharacterized protein n=1 Tax=Cupriavidus basilensis TaxID=68895 RepID=A0A0C4YQV0_9BURK|nr:hypothetical protein RR42_s3269 [Cupriavidus basilensis]